MSAVRAPANRAKLVEALGRLLPTCDGNFRQTYARQLLAELEAIGVRLVPADPTKAMIDEGWIDKEDVDVEDIYWAMLSASPYAPDDAK